MNFSLNEIATLVKDFMAQAPDPTDEEVDDFFSIFSEGYPTDSGNSERDIAIDIYNRAFMGDPLDGLGKTRMTKWVPDDKAIEKFSGDNLIKRGNLLGFKDYETGVTFHNYPEGHKSRNSFLRSLGYIPTNQVSGIWITPDHKKRVKVNNQNGRLSFEKVRESTESLDKGVNMGNSLTAKLLDLVKGSATENQGISGVGNIKPLGPGFTGRAFENKCKEDYEEALEAIERTGLDRLQSVFAQLLEKIGAIQLLDNINNAPDDFGSDYYDQINFIKNTMDLSDTNEVLNELLKASETLLDDTQIELLADDLENSGEDFNLMEETPEGEEFPEEDWEDEGDYDWSSDDSQEIEEENLEETPEENTEEIDE